MRRKTALIAAALSAAFAACGDDTDTAKDTRTVTSEFLTSLKDRDYREVSTPGTGGFIETPQQRRREKDVPPVKQAANGESVFTGVLSRAYIRARAACHAMSRAQLRRQAGAGDRSPTILAGVYAAKRYPPELWQAAFEGCAVGAASR